MRCFIGVGELNKNLYILLLAVLFKVLSEFIYGVKYPLNAKEKSLYFYDSKLKKNLIVQSICKFLGITVLSFIYYKYENHQVNNKEHDSNDNNLINSKKSEKNGTTKENFTLIYNKKGPNNTKYIVQILLMGFLLGFLELIIQIYNSFAAAHSDYWTFEILFTALFMRKIFKINLYNHQLFSILFIAILCSLTKFLLFLHKQNNKFNLNLLFIPGYILIVLIRSYVYTKIKWIIDIRYISILKMLFIYGAFGLFLSLIICILTKIIPGNVDDNIGNTYDDLNSISWWQYIIEIILIIFYMCLKFFYKFCYMLTLKNFSPMHVLVNDTIYYLIIRIFLVINKFLDILYDDENRDEYFDDAKVVIYSVLNHIFAFFGYLVFVELVELKFCNCDYDLRKNIIKRSRVDSIGSNILNEEENIQEEEAESNDVDQKSNSSDPSV